jgi:hypothetical protein
MLRRVHRVNDNLISTSENEDIVRTFEKHGVEFILVGGLAVS